MQNCTCLQRSKYDNFVIFMWDLSSIRKKKCNLNYSNFPNKQKGMNQILIQTPIDNFNSSISRK